MRAKDIERLIKSVVNKVYKMYPDVEWDDLVSQGWLIVTEKIGRYDKDRGASLSTYLYHQIQGGLQDYIQRVLLKELNMRGMRVHGEDAGASVDIQDQVEAKLTVESILKRSKGTSRLVIASMMRGNNQTEAARDIGISRQRVGQVIKEIREEYNG